jgi:molybdopterin molybdotransferase
MRDVKPTLGTERLSLGDCGGRILAADVRARVPSPPFTNSAMDGFAVRHADVQGQAGPFPVSATILARPLRPGDLPDHKAGTVVRIMTGASVPPWADTVVPVEQTDLDGSNRVTFRELPASGANIRVCGSDLAEGNLILRAGQILTPERILVAAAFGHGSLEVKERPQLALFSTGDELVEPGMPLPPGAVYNSSKYFLMASAKALGFHDPLQKTLPDSEAAAAAAIKEVLDSGKSSLIISTGAVSAGDADFVPQLGLKLGFWHFFARTLLAAFGLPPPVRRTLVLQNEVRKPESLRCFFRAEVSGTKAWVAERQGSAQLAASINNDAYVELPEGFSRIPAETRVEAIIA